MVIVAGYADEVQIVDSDRWAAFYSRSITLPSSTRSTN